MLQQQQQQQKHHLQQKNSNASHANLIKQSILQQQPQNQNQRSHTAVQHVHSVEPSTEKHKPRSIKKNEDRPSNLSSSHIIQTTIDVDSPGLHTVASKVSYPYNNSVFKSTDYLINKSSAGLPSIANSSYNFKVSTNGLLHASTTSYNPARQSNLIANYSPCLAIPPAAPATCNSQNLYTYPDHLIAANNADSSNCRLIGANNYVRCDQIGGHHSTIDIDERANYSQQQRLPSNLGTKTWSKMTNSTLNKSREIPYSHHTYDTINGHLASNMMTSASYLDAPLTRNNTHNTAATRETLPPIRDVDHENQNHVYTNSQLHNMTSLELDPNDNHHNHLLNTQYEQHKHKVLQRQREKELLDNNSNKYTYVNNNNNNPGYSNHTLNSGTQTKNTNCSVTETTGTANQTLETVNYYNNLAKKHGCMAPFDLNQIMVIFIILIIIVTNYWGWVRR